MPPAPSSDSVERPSISGLHSDVLLSHILTRLDGPALASAGATSSQLRLLSGQPQLWRDICVASWPSIHHPLLRQVISDHRSFFSNVFPLLDCRSLPCDRRCTPPPELISAVDIHYRGELLFSKVHSIETQTSWSLSSPFRVDLLDPKDSISTPLRRAESGASEEWFRHVEENLTVSWIVMDPVQKRAANISSRSPVKLQRHWLTGDLQIEYTIIMAGDTKKGSSSEFVQCGVGVSFGNKEEDEAEEGVEMKMNLTEVSLRMLDMEGRHLNGKESLQILWEAMEKGKRIKGKGEEGKQRYEEFTEMRMKRIAKKERRENTIDMVFVATGITIFLGFWCFILFR